MNHDPNPLFHPRHIRQLCAMDPGLPVQVHGRLRDLTEGLTRTDQQRYASMRLLDATGEIACYYWGALPEPYLELSDYTLVAVRGRLRHYRGAPCLDLQELWPADLDDMPFVSVVPHDAAALRPLVEQLVNYVEAVSDTDLYAFCRRLFADLRFTRPFFSLPASHRHHHTEPGGLARHSLEVAYLAGTTSHLRRSEQELAFVGGLLHDAGKVLTLAGPRTVPFVAHEAVTLEMLAAPLAALPRRKAQLLRHVWTCGLRPYHHETRTPVARAVMLADQLSVQEDLAGGTD